MKLVLLLAVCAVRCVFAADVPFSLLVAQESVVNFDMSVAYKNDEQTEFVPYESCDGSDECVELNWDDDAELRVTVNFPTAEQLEDFGPVEVAGNTLTTPVEFKIMACFETEFTKNRKWRKPKDIIQDDKRCAKKVVDKQSLLEGEQTFDYAIKSDMPRGRFFLTLFLFCRVPGTDSDEYCAIDTTGPLDALAKMADVQKRLDENADASEIFDRVETSDPLTFKTTVIDSRPPELIICVVILSIVSVSMLVLYFVYERALKKRA